jgi:hypothetical protein
MDDHPCMLICSRSQPHCISQISPDRLSFCYCAVSSCDVLYRYTTGVGHLIANVYQRNAIEKYELCLRLHCHSDRPLICLSRSLIRQRQRAEADAQAALLKKKKSVIRSMHFPLSLLPLSIPHFRSTNRCFCRVVAWYGIANAMHTRASLGHHKVSVEEQKSPFKLKQFQNVPSRVTQRFGLEQAQQSAYFGTSPKRPSTVRVRS